MKGITPEQLVEILAFIQKHHRFGWVKEEDRVTEYPFSIKYVDTVYDSRDETIWAIAFRPPHIRFATNHYNGLNQPPEGWKYDNLFDLVMDYLTGKFVPTDEFMLDKRPHYTTTVRMQMSPEEHDAIIKMATEKTKDCIKLIEQMDGINNEPDEFVGKEYLAIPIQVAILDVYYEAMALKDDHEEPTKE